MQIVRVFVGLDYHESSIRVCVLTEEGDVLLNRSVANDTLTVVDVVKNLGVVSVQGVALEACCGAADFATSLAAATEWNVKLAHAGAVQRLKQGPDKTDHGDAWHLANLLRVNYLPEVWLADSATRQLRRLVRYRQGLVEERKAIKLRILALLREERVGNSSGANIWTRTWRTWLTTVRLGEHSRWVLEHELARLTLLDADVAEVEARMEQATRDDELVARLLKQPGIGPVTAVTMRAVIGRFDRFQTGKQLSRYCGVTPCNASSGKRQADAGLIEAGNDILRPMLIQLAKRLPRHEPRWRDLKVKLMRTKGANVAAAAIANRWLRRLYYDVQRPPVQAG